MSYKFRSKNDELYHKNYLSLMRAIENAGGNSSFVLKNSVEEFLATLAQNNIEVVATFHENLEKLSDFPKLSDRKSR